MAAADQAARGELIAAGVESPPPELAERLRAIDRVNARRMGEIIDAFGWPTVRQVGPDGAGAAFLIAQHATHDLGLQLRALAAIEAARSGGDPVPGEHVALLRDRTRLAQGLEQLYGTQAEIRGGRVVLLPIADPPRVDERRRSLGLPPLDDYLRELEELYLGPRDEESPWGS